VEAGARGNFGRNVSGSGGGFAVRDRSSSFKPDLIDAYDATLNTDDNKYYVMRVPHRRQTWIYDCLVLGRTRKICYQ
jgi:hypothetical protein